MKLDFSKCDSNEPVAMCKFLKTERLINLNQLGFTRSVIFLYSIPKHGYFLKIGDVSFATRRNNNFSAYNPRLIDCLLNKNETLESEAYKTRVQAIFDDVVKKYDLIPFDWDNFAKLDDLD